MEKKMTYTQAINEALSLGTLSADAVERLTALRASIENRSSKSEDKRKAKSAEVNDTLSKAVVEAMVGGMEYTTGDLAKMVDSNTSRMSIVMKGLTESGAVVVRDGTEKGQKGKKVYSLAE